MFGMIKQKKLSFVPSLIVSIMVAVFYTVAVAQSSSDPEKTGVLLVFTYIVSAMAVLTIILNVVWSFFSRKKYEKIIEANADLTRVLEAKEMRLEDLKTELTDFKADQEIIVKELRFQIKGLTVSNGAVVTQNLQAKAILKQQRLAGKWDGHEDDLFNLKENE